MCSVGGGGERLGAACSVAEGGERLGVGGGGERLGVACPVGGGGERLGVACSVGRWRRRAAVRNRVGVVEESVRLRPPGWVVVARAGRCQETMPWIRAPRIRAPGMAAEATARKRVVTRCVHVRARAWMGGTDQVWNEPLCDGVSAL